MMLGNATSFYPFVHFIFLELPETPMRCAGISCFIDAVVYGVIADPEVFATLALIEVKAWDNSHTYPWLHEIDI